MALEGQLTFLSTELEPDIQRSRYPRRSPRLRINEEEEEDGVDGEKNTDFATRAPIIGYEVVDQRQKFTVYKIQVKTGSKKWFVFRRYTDFTRLNDKLRDAYPNFRIRLPGKRWFKDNFDPEFIEERARGLQFFINNLLNHSEISESPEIHDFFCLNDPPGPYDSLEESRAYCQHLENQAEDLRQKVDELTAELEMTKSQLIQARVQQEALVSALQLERTLRKRGPVEKRGDSALVDEIIAENEKRTRSNSLRERFSPLLSQPRRRTNSKGKMLFVADAMKDDKNLWEGSIEITEHSSGACADRMRPSKLSRRNSEERRTHGPHTSTPVLTSTPSSDLDGIGPKPASHLEESLDDRQKALKGCEENGQTNTVFDSSGVFPTEASNEGLEDKYDHCHVIRKVSGEQAGQKHSSKRDSGISIDNSPTPST